jgi:DsbC/DsbD-like thiol-disulfide interchange protein
MSTVRTAACLLVVVVLAVIDVARSQGVVRVNLASPWVELHAARVRLVAGAPADKSARSYLAGVEITLAEGWKTYWRTPGDAGVPPYFDWTGSTNVAKIEVRYPAPSRLDEPAALTIGYKNSVIFPVEVTPRDAMRPADLKLSAQFGICREICIPADTAISLTLVPSQLEGEASPALLAALERVPRPQQSRRAGDPELVRVTPSLGDAAPHLTIEARFPIGDPSADVFVEAPEGLYVPQPKRLPDGADGTLRFRIDLVRGGNAHDLEGKTLTLTLVGDAGATEATWTVP